MPEARECKCGSALAHAIDHRSQSDSRSDAKKLELLVGKYLLASRCWVAAYAVNSGHRRYLIAQLKKTTAARCCRWWSNGSVICSSRDCVATYDKLFTEVIERVAPELCSALATI